MFTARKPILFLYFLIASILLKADPINKGFKALGIYNYFEAKRLFYKKIKKRNAYAAYGLATIYHRNDNPFYNTDSATKYIVLAKNWFKVKPERKVFDAFIINDSSIQVLLNTIAENNYGLLVKPHDSKKLNQFIVKNYLADKALINRVVEERDELDYLDIANVNTSEATKMFILKHPVSLHLKKAEKLLEIQQFNEETTGGKPEDYIRFIKKHPSNHQINSAYQGLLDYYRIKEDTNGLQMFITNYPNAPQQTEAWQLLFHLKVKEHNFKEIEAFLKEHPKFPFKNNLLRELELIHLTLIPYAKDDSFGFIDTTGKYVISPVYDDVKAFHEELAVVNVNDSLFYIDKDNVRYINQTFSEAYSFYKGIAGVKKENKWFLIDRLGNKHSDFFDDMNELSEEKYIVKNNNLFGCINQHGDYIIPCELEKMGDFKNSAAYYTKDGKYGFIHIQNNYTAPALFDWLSNFDEKGIAVFKMNNRFGLINSKGQKLCDANYDQLLRISDSLYLAVVNNKYGFISHSGCEILAVEYDYNPLIPITEYEGNGYLLCIIDEKKFFKSHDGLSFFQKHKFDDIYVPAEQLVLVQKKNKYGFVNLNGDKVIPTQYLSAEKFIKGTAIVETEEGFTLIDRLGNKLIPETAEIKRFNENLLFISGEKDELIDKTGKILQNNIKSYEVYKPYLLLELEKGEIKVIRFE